MPERRTIDSNPSRAAGHCRDAPARAQRNRRRRLVASRRYRKTRRVTCKSTRSIGGLIHDAAPNKFAPIYRSDRAQPSANAHRAQRARTVVKEGDKRNPRMADRNAIEAPTPTDHDLRMSSLALYYLRTTRNPGGVCLAVVHDNSQRDTRFPEANNGTRLVHGP